VARPVDSPARGPYLARAEGNSAEFQPRSPNHRQTNPENKFKGRCCGKLPRGRGGSRCKGASSAFHRQTYWARESPWVCPMELAGRPYDAHPRVWESPEHIGQTGRSYAGWGWARRLGLGPLPRHPPLCRCRFCRGVLSVGYYKALLIGECTRPGGTGRRRRPR